MEKEALILQFPIMLRITDQAHRIYLQQPDLRDGPEYLIKKADNATVSQVGEENP